MHSCCGFDSPCTESKNKLYLHIYIINRYICEQFSTLINHIIMLHENQIREKWNFFSFQPDILSQSNAKMNMHQNLKKKNKHMDILITNLHSWGENLLEGQWMHHGKLQNKINHSMFCETYCTPIIYHMDQYNTLTWPLWIPYFMRVLNSSIQRFTIKLREHKIANAKIDHSFMKFT